jgi:dephospho-CoA kinase
MQSNKRPLLIGITGTYGSGKSTFCKLIEQYYPVIYSDLLAHKVLNYEEVIKLIQARWGRGVITDGKPDRKAISSRVFQNKTELDFLNSVIHPRVLERMQTIVDEADCKILFFEIPLLFEARLESCFDHIILVTVSPDNRQQRIRIRDKSNNDEIDAIVKAQLPESIKTQLADTIIPNDGTPAELEAQMELWLAKLPSLNRKSVLRFT